MGAADILSESGPERAIGKEILSLPTSDFCFFRNRHQGLQHDAVQACEERNILLPWAGEAYDRPVESGTDGLVPDTHHALPPLDFTAGHFRNAFKKSAGQHHIGAVQFKQSMR